MADFNEDLATSLGKNNPVTPVDDITPEDIEELEGGGEGKDKGKQPDPYNPFKDDFQEEEAPKRKVVAKKSEDIDLDDEDLDDTDDDSAINDKMRQADEKMSLVDSKLMELDIKTFLNEPGNDKFKKYEGTVKKISAMQGMERFKIKSLFYMAAGDDLTYILADKIKSANKNAVNTVVNTPKPQSKGAVDFNSMDSKTFQEYRRQVEQGIIKPGQPMKKIAS